MTRYGTTTNKKSRDKPYGSNGAKVLPFSNGTKDDGGSCGAVARRPKSPHPQIKQTSKQTILINLRTNLLFETAGAKVLYLSAMAPETMVVAVVANDN